VQETAAPRFVLRTFHRPKPPPDCLRLVSGKDAIADELTPTVWIDGQQCGGLSRLWTIRGAGRHGEGHLGIVLSLAWTKACPHKNRAAKKSAMAFAQRPGKV